MIQTTKHLGKKLNGGKQPLPVELPLYCAVFTSAYDAIHSPTSTVLVLN